jgi:uncharacterized protein (DUF58 family)
VLPEELLKKVKLIELTTRKMVDDVMSGGYKSHFKGHGVQFSDHRLYVPGDDVRHIDWKVSARTRDPQIKKYEEERELNVLLVIDVSGSKFFGSTKKLKSEVAAELAGMIAYAATHTGDKVGAMFFAGEIEKIIPPKKGRNHILRIVRDILDYKPSTRGTSLSDALDSAGRLMKHGGIVFVLSDFIAQGYEKSLKRLAARHDVVSIMIQDEREKVMPDVGQILITDPESGEEAYIDTGSYGFKTWLKEFQKGLDAEKSGAAKGQVEIVKVQTQDDYADTVVRFFRARARRKRR